MAKQELDKKAKFLPPPSEPHLSHQEMSALKHICAGAITGGLSILIIYPADYLKTVLQLDGLGKRKYRGAWHLFRSVIQIHGFRRLYRGFPILFFGSMPQIAVRFSVFELLRKEMEGENGHLSNFAKLFCGTGAGIVEALTILTPMETVKVKYVNELLQTNPKYKGIVHCGRSIFQKEGWHGLYQGPLTTVLKQSSIEALVFFTIENLKDLYRGNDSNKKISAPVTGLMGVCAGICATIGSHPIDVLKTYMQSSDGHKFKSTLDCAIQTFKRRGIKGYYAGLGPRLFRVCLDVAVTFMIYDMLIEFFDNSWPSKMVIN